MTYVRAQRYLLAQAQGASPEQFFALCMRLGRIHTGIRKVALSANQSGTCRMDYLESILLCAGYRVGRWTKMGTDDLRSRILIDGQPIAHKQVCALCEQMMREIEAMQKEDESLCFDSEQKLCALALLAFCCHGCDVILLDVAGDCTQEPMWVAAPFTLVMPCGLGTKDTALAKNQAALISRAIRRGTREVICGFVGGEVYNMLSQACAAAGSRLTVPAKSEVVISEQALARTVFTYRGKGPYRLHSSYAVQKEAALAAIEACYALRRDGVRLPGQAMAAGLQKAQVALCFDVITVRPGVIASVACTQEDVRALLCALHEKSSSFGGKVVLCTEQEPKQLLSAFGKEFADEDGYAVQEIVYVGLEAAQNESFPLTVCATSKRAAKRILSMTDPDTTTLILGQPKFVQSVKEAVTDALIGLS